MKHTIWTSEIDLANWLDAIIEDYPELKGDDYKCYDIACQYNDDYLDDERANLTVSLDTEIIILGDLGLWNGRRQGYKYLQSKVLSDCLYSDDDGIEWYVEDGELKVIGHHHDGTNYYLYRRLKPGLSWTQRDNMEDKFYSGNYTQKDIDKYTLPLGNEVAKIYGWED